ncbi:MAG: tRNA (adenosine(37)-N6)-dimethylallyltransferase MiaA [Spirochaetales bacterium]|nr:tRNA (adenosine(37)-N6)-dimethylallyltransferase MiaA [Spirochaetales bacterium]
MNVRVLCGPTASGKTQISALLDPDRYEIISCDSRQLYRGLTIGSALPPPELRERLRHHLLDFLPPDQEYSAARFATEARQAIEDIVARGKEPVIVGGAGFYLRALMFGMFPAVADSVEREVARMEPGQRLDYLRRLDPLALLEKGGHIHENDAYRIERALALTLSSGKRFSLHWQEARERIQKRDTGSITFTGYTIVCNPSELRQRIQERAAQMIASGLLEETRMVREKYGECAALQTLGYPLACQVLLGVRKEAELHHALATAHYQYARRQAIWFKRESFCLLTREVLFRGFAGGSFPDNF